MSQLPEGIRASDADRDSAASALAEAVASGRLSLAEHEQRLDVVFGSVTQQQLAAVTADLPALPVRRSALYKAADAHRCVVIGGEMQRAGRFGIGRFCTLTALSGRVGLDLRAAVPSQDEITLTMWSVASAVTVTAPVGWTVSSQVLVLGRSQAMADREGRPGQPRLLVRGSCFGGTFRLLTG